MSENSDGSKGDPLKIPKISEQFPPKTRSFSLGSCGISKSEINKIIGIRDKDPKQIKTYAGKSVITKSTDNQAENQNKLPGAFDKCMLESDKQKNLEINIAPQNEVFCDPGDVFKPRKSVARTPPANKQINQNDILINKNAEEISYKRNRSDTDSTPEKDKLTKRQCDGLPLENQEKISNQGDHIFLKEISDNGNSETLSTENIILQVFSALDTIQKTECCQKDDQGSIRDSISTIHKSLSLLVHKIGILEKDKMVLEFQVTMQNQERKRKDTNRVAEEVSITREMLPQRTYASVTHKQSKSRSETTENSEEWKTPQTKKKLETVIRIDQITDARETVRQLKSEISGRDTQGGFKNIRQLKSGAVVVESCSETQQEKLRLALKSRKDIEIKESRNTDPMFAVTGIQKGISDDEFINELIRLNNEIEKDLQYSVIDKIKVIYKKPCRNPTKENWILQAPAEITKWFLKKQTVIFDLVKVYVQEHINLAICLRCSGFGHVAKYCKDTLCCHKCGGDHLGKDCPVTRMKCPNCTKMRYRPEDNQHSARDTNCPVYRRRIEQFRNQINYSSPFL